MESPWEKVLRGFQQRTAEEQKPQPQEAPKRGPGATPKVRVRKPREK